MLMWSQPSLRVSISGQLGSESGIRRLRQITCKLLRHQACKVTVVARSGYSHRRFIWLFRNAAGMTPKLYCRVLRFQAILKRVATNPSVSWADLAMESGYSDQSHFNR